MEFNKFYMQFQDWIIRQLTLVWYLVRLKIPEFL